MSTLNSCERDIQTVLNEAIKHTDFSVIFGNRSIELQQELYAKGRKDGKVVDISKVVTYLDGVNKKSKHNYQPSKAVDIVPWPGGYSAPVEEFFYMAATVLTISNRFFIEGKIEKRLEWGGRWQTLVDTPHFQL